MSLLLCSTVIPPVASCYKLLPLFVVLSEIKFSLNCTSLFGGHLLLSLQDAALVQDFQTRSRPTRKYYRQRLELQTAVGCKATFNLLLSGYSSGSSNRNTLFMGSL